MTRRYFDFWDMERELAIKNLAAPMLDLNPLQTSQTLPTPSSLTFEELLRVTATLLCPVGCLAVWSEALCCPEGYILAIRDESQL